ncbi:MAG: hypothetical protein ACREYC_19135, partial [Gammaproteobacteria bacterium]
AKTDRLDGVKRVTMLMRYWAGERGLLERGAGPECGGRRRAALTPGAGVSEEGAHPASQSDLRFVSRAGPAPGA